MSAADLMARIDAARGDRQRASDMLAEARGMGRGEEPQPPEPEGGGLLDALGGISDIGHTVLDVAGLIPVVGSAADLINAGWYAAEGDYANAGLSALGAVPGFGDAATTAKLVGTAAVGLAGAAAAARRLPNQADALIDGGRQVRGKFPKVAGPNEVLYRVGDNGRASYYQVYGADNLPVKRVDLDLKSRTHASIPPPHVQEFTRGTNPNTGQTFVNKGIVRPARPDEIPNVN